MTTSPVPSDTDRLADDMRREIVLREINQGALAGMSSEITGQAADLVLAALNAYDTWKAQQGGGDLAEVRAALRPGFAITLSQLIAETQQDTHPYADAVGSTGPYIVQGCVVYGAQQLRDALRTVWKRTPKLLDELEAARAEVASLQARLTAAEEALATANAKSESLGAKLKHFLDGQSRIAREIDKTTDKFEQQRLLGLAEARATLRSALDGDDDFMAPTIRACTGCGKCDYCAYPARALGLGEGDSDA